jgi:hypothetical protein
MEGATPLFNQPAATLVVAAQDLMKVGGFDEAAELSGEKFAVQELAGRLALVGCKELLLTQSATIWRVPDNSYRFVNPVQSKPATPLPRVVSPEFSQFVSGVSQVLRVGDQLSELEVLNLVLLSGNFTDVLSKFDRNSCAPDAAVVLAAINDQVTAIDRGEFGRLEAAAEKASANRAALSMSIALLLFFRGQFSAAEQWIRHGLAAQPLYSKLWLLLCEVKVAQKASPQDILGIALEGVRSFPRQALFFQRALQALQSK